jgi:hypothetical protein
MKKFMLLALGAAVVMILSAPPVAQAQLADAIELTHWAVNHLTDWPAQGKRSTAYDGSLENPRDYGKDPRQRDYAARWGADLSQIKKSTAHLQDALGKARAGGAGRDAIRLLEEAVAYGKAQLHKEERLSAQGALYFLCKGNNGEPKDICDKQDVLKYGQYVAP